MLKHILTYRCPRACDYCIARNVILSQVVHMKKLKELYVSMYREGHKAIMLTGGEPTIAEGFTSILAMAYAIFDEVYLTTADITWIDRQHARQRMIKAITFSAHDLRSFKHHRVWVEAGTVVYASIMDHQYKDGLAQHLFQLGFAGLTINENHWGGHSFDANVLAGCATERFSIRLNRRGSCINDGTKMIMPDLTLSNSFEQYMGEPGAVHEYDPKYQR